MKLLIWILVAALIVAHHDFWNWDSDQILFGFMPIGLVYHVGISIAAALVWAFACTFAWPQGVDQFDDPTAEANLEKDLGVDQVDGVQS